MSPWSVVLAAVLLLGGAYPYVRRAKHGRTRMLAAYLIFVGVFALVAALVYLLLGAALLAAGLAGALDSPAGAILFLAVVFLPAFFIARALIKRPPHRPVTPP